MVTMFYIFYVISFCIIHILGHLQEQDNNDVMAVLIIIVAAFFLIMLTGLYCGHLFFLGIKQKTTNEALKKSEKYGYNLQ